MSDNQRPEPAAMDLVRLLLQSYFLCQPRFILTALPMMVRELDSVMAKCCASLPVVE